MPMTKAPLTPGYVARIVGLDKDMVIKDVVDVADKAYIRYYMRDMAKFGLEPHIDILVDRLAH